MIKELIYLAFFKALYFLSVKYFEIIDISCIIHSISLWYLHELDALDCCTQFVQAITEIYAEYSDWTTFDVN